jgi:hypothetical protein
MAPWLFTREGATADPALPCHEADRLAQAAQEGRDRQVTYGVVRNSFNLTGDGIASAIERALKPYDIGMTITCEINHTFSMLDTVDFIFIASANVAESEDRLPFQVRIKLLYKVLADNFPSLRPQSHWTIFPNKPDGDLIQGPLTVANLTEATQWGELKQVDFDHEVTTIVNRARVMIRSAVGPADFLNIS